MKINVLKAIVIGQLWINIPVILIIILVTGFISSVTNLPSGLPILLGGILAWLYWSFFIHRWRKWAISKGVDASELQKWAQRTLLTWKEGSIFEKTEIHSKKD